LQTITDFTRISFSDLVELKIPALSGRGVDNNQRILRSIALKGPMLKYDIFKDVGMNYHSTVSRRVDNLVKKGYLREASKRVTERGKKTAESEYGLTWRGFIAALAIREVRENIPQTLEKNPLLNIPEKEIVLSILKELITTQELEIIAESMLEAYLKTIPNLELVENEPMNLFASLLSMKEMPKPPEGFRLSKFPKDYAELLTLLDRPAIFKVIKERVIPLIRQQTITVKMLYQFLVAFNELGDYISNLETKDKPSEKIKQYMETKLLPKLSELSDTESPRKHQNPKLTRNLNESINFHHKTSS
jgi:hypothetical protein